jgi:hypothetical protein
MAETVGLVACVKVGDGFAFTTLVFQAPVAGVLHDREHFSLWWNGVTTPWKPDASMLAKHDQWVSLLQDAMAYNFSVTITHADDSLIVSSVQVGFPLLFW